ncbi:MAG: hypothetical protein Q4P14_01530 [Methanobacteriaceae archaeon]|nr:hypothetical protein [Methanobacteriaceae archaeon]
MLINEVGPAIIVCFIAYIALYGIAILIKSNHKYLGKLNPERFLPLDERYYLDQIFLIFCAIFCIIGGILSFYLVGSTNFIEVCFFNIVTVTIFILYLAEKSILKFILCLLLVPAASLIYVIYSKDVSLLLIPNYIGILIAGCYFVYKFIKFTRMNNLELTVLIFAFIITISMIVTTLGEKASLVDSMVMVSNAFTSNGYTVLGDTYWGKIDSILLVWGGYLLSGVGTATLAAGIISHRFNKQINSKENELSELKEEVNGLTNEIKELKTIIQEK